MSEPSSPTLETHPASDLGTRPSSNAELPGPPHAVRHRLPAERPSITHRYSVGGHEGYITVGFYPDGQPGELFLRMAKEGSTMAGLMECFGTAVSVGLQHGVPLKILCEKFARTRFEPSGWTGNEELGYWDPVAFVTAAQQLLAVDTASATSIDEEAR